MQHMSMEHPGILMTRFEEFKKSVLEILLIGLIISTSDKVAQSCNASVVNYIHHHTHTHTDSEKENKCF